ncbi:MAG: methyltransferase domain-containing protein [Nitrospirae bacterium]|nr:methyltransferase domain-containing protein [Nitrospirota bacterium]
MSTVSFARRNTGPELMDTHPFSFEEFRSYLRELERVNRWTLAYRPTLHWLKRALAVINKRRCLSILDVGSGNGDMLRQIWKWAQRRGVDVELTGVDFNPRAKKAAEEATPTGAPIRFETANVFDLAPANPFDFIICSLFTHHLTDEQNVRFLRWLDDHALHGWFINDLHRHPLPYAFIKYAARFLRLNPSVRYDAPLSVARAFTAADWQRLLKKAEIPLTQTRISRWFPFRYCVTRFKS